MRIEKLNLGSFEIYGLQDGLFHLDGGAMFGVVPKVLWQRKFPADERNRIKLALNCLLIKTKDALVLIETGIGSKLDPKSSDLYSVKTKPGLIPSLSEVGYGIEDLNFVINTHLHFDHCGGNTYKNNKGEIVPTFPKTKYIIQKGEWEYALHPCLRDRTSYLNDNFLPLEKHGLAGLIEGNKKIVEGVEVILVPGHTAFHQCVKVQSQGKALFFLGDLVPTSGHIGLPYIMSYDLYPLETLKNKEIYYQEAIKEDWILAFNHDPEHYFGKVEKDGDKYKFQPFLA
ncbi:MAG: MBL fold metallo-hydrolase [Candidatus Aminicenantes bacterium]|nr:MBL fold metallo-hydrolase [Candidatus Aminicenantes bacterium]